MLLVQPVAAGQVGAPTSSSCAKAKPGKLSYGSAGPGSPQHLSCELFKTMTGTNIVHVPYRGDAPALNDLVAGHIPTDVRASRRRSLPLIRAGKVRALGVSSRNAARSDAPDIPTLAEAGVPGFDFVSWQMIVAPAGTPKPIVDRLHRELKAIIATCGRCSRNIAKTGRIAVDSPPPDELLAFMRSEIVRLGKVVESAAGSRGRSRSPASAHAVRAPQSGMAVATQDDVAGTRDFALARRYRKTNETAPRRGG